MILVNRGSARSSQEKGGRLEGSCVDRLPLVGKSGPTMNVARVVAGKSMPCELRAICLRSASWHLPDCQLAVPDPH